MPDNTILNLGSGGDTILTEDLSGVKVATTKIYVGAHGVNGGAVTAGNPLPVSVNGAVPLPTGASTAAKQPALGTAGSAAADVLTVQGVASMTPLLTTTTLATGFALIGTTASPDACDSIYNGITPLTPIRAAISAAASGSNTLVAAVPGKKILVLKAALMAAGAVNATFKSSTTSSLTGAFPLAANGGVGIGYCPLGNLATVAGEALTLNLDAAVQVSGYLVYVPV